jgi:plastocyanin
VKRVGATRAFAVVAAGMLLTLGLQACSSDSKDPVALTVTASEQSGGQMKFDIPATIDGGVVKITFKNTGTQPHELQLVRVKDGTTADQFVKDVLENESAPIPDYVLGPAGGAGPTAPGATTTVTQKLDPGTYVYVCSMGDGDAVHYKHGMLGTVTVKGDKGKGDLPKSTATVTAKEYGYDITGLKAGTNTVLWQNVGKELHMAMFIPMNPGTTLDQVKAAFSAPPDQQTGPPPVDFSKATGLEVIAPGDKLVQDSLTLEKGSYVVLCFVTDRAGGPPHLAKGMIQQLDVS